MNANELLEFLLKLKSDGVDLSELDVYSWDRYEDVITACEKVEFDEESVTLY